MTHRSAQTVFLGILAFIAIFATLRIGQNLFAPLVAAMVLGIVCAPATDRVERFGLPRALAAMLVLALLVALTTAAFVALEPSISRGIQNAPAIWREVTEVLDMVRGTLAGAQELQDTVTEALNDGPPTVDAADEAVVTVPGVMDALALAPSFAAALLIFAGSFYFFLISRCEIYARIEKGPLALSEQTLSRAEARVSRYFLTITIINATFGVLVGLAMALLGLGQPILWGMAAFLINFILYLGPACLAVAFLVAGLVSFDGALGFAPFAVYLGMNMTEGQFVTPALVGRHMKVNPLLIFVSLVFWLWLWGPVGGVVAIPVLVWCLYVFGHLDRDAPETSRTPALHGNAQER